MNDEEIMDYIRNYFSNLTDIDYKEKFIREFYHEFITTCKHIDELKLTGEKIEFVVELEKYFIKIEREWSDIQVDLNLEPEVKYREEIYEKIDYYLKLFIEITSDTLSLESFDLRKKALITAQKAYKKARTALIVAIVGFFLSIAISVFLSRYC